MLIHKNAKLVLQKNLTQLESIVSAVIQALFLINNQKLVNALKINHILMEQLALLVQNQTTGTRSQINARAVKEILLIILY